MILFVAIFVPRTTRNQSRRYILRLISAVAIPQGSVLLGVDFPQRLLINLRFKHWSWWLSIRWLTRNWYRQPMLTTDNMGRETRQDMSTSNDEERVIWISYYHDWEVIRCGPFLWGSRTGPNDSTPHFFKFMLPPELAVTSGCVISCRVDRACRVVDSFFLFSYYDKLFFDMRRRTDNI